MDKALISILAAIAIPAYQDYTARAQAAEGFKATAGLQSDIGVYASDVGKLPAGKTDATDAKVAALLNQARNLDGKYFSKSTTDTGTGGVTLHDNGIIGIKFDAGVNADHGMTLTPTLNSANGQISKWACAGDTAKSGAKKALASNRLPTSCQETAAATS